MKTVEKHFQIVHKEIKAFDSELDIHDFRVVEGPTHTNLIFDVVVPHRYKLTDTELKKEITQRVKAVNQFYCLVITVDNCYI